MVYIWTRCMNAGNVITVITLVTAAESFRFSPAGP